MAVIPGPRQMTPAPGGFRFAPGCRVAFGGPALGPLVGRFCAEAGRRTGIHARALPLGAGDAAPGITVGLGGDPRLARLPVPLGVDPAATAHDERYALAIGPDGITLRAPEPAGAARGLMTLLQLISTAAPDPGGAVPLPGALILDAPRFRWRGLTVDVARTFFDAVRIRALIDLVALYKLNVLHLHLTDDQGWRIEAGRPAAAREPDGTFFTNGELRALARYAADRFVTLLPEVDVPGHAAALLRLHPRLASGRDPAGGQPAPGRGRGAWLDPALPATFGVLDEVFAELAAAVPGAFLHIGGDELAGMPDQAYAAFVRRVQAMVHALGRRTVGWQESVRAGAGPGHLIQYWMSAAPAGDGATPVAPGVARSRADLEQAFRYGVPVIVSPLSNCYLDVPYAGPPAGAGQRDRWQRVGNRSYAPRTPAATFDWEPLAALGTGASSHDIAGVGAAVWCETVRDFGDLTFLLLPRLAGIAEKAWGAANAVRWPEHRDALARHGRLWDFDRLTFFRAPGERP